MSKSTLQNLFERVRNGFVANTCEDCAALLVMALGAASELVQLVHASAKSHGFESRQQQSELMTMASVCFDEAMKLLNVAYMEISTISTQCVFLAASVEWSTHFQNSADFNAGFIARFYNVPCRLGVT